MMVRGALAGLVVLTLMTSGSSAQQDSAATDSPRPPIPQNIDFADAIQVKVINIEVHVTDKKGNPVKGLTIDDFEVTENRDPVTLTNFYEVDEGRRTDGLDQEVRTRLPGEPPPLKKTTTYAVPEDRRLHLVVYVDHQNIRPHNRNRVFRFLRQFLREHLDREDKVMLASYNRSLKVERPFTSDPGLISRALFDLEKHTGGRTSVDSDRRELLEALTREETQFVTSSSRIKMFAEEQYNDLQFTMDGLRKMVDMLAGIPGRKSILYVSDGLPMRPGAELFEAAAEAAVGQGFNREISDIRMEVFQYDASRRFTDLANAANGNDVSFYTLDASGLLGRSMRGADMRGGPLTSNIESAWANNMQSSIMFLADETGGQFAVNTNNFDAAFDRFAQDFEHYYSLGFSPGHAGSGRLYNLKVRLKGNKGKGLVVRYRGAYRDKSIEKEMAETTTAALQFGFEKNDLNVRVEEASRVRRDDGTWMVQVDVVIPLGELVLVPGPDFHTPKLRMWVQARDGDGGLSDPAMTPIDIPPIPNEDLEIAKQQVYRYTVPLIMKGGDQWVTVGLRDDLAGESSFVTRALRLPT